MPGYLSVTDSKTIALEGSWRLAHLQEIADALAEISPQSRSARVLDGSKLEELDTASAMLLFKYLAPTTSNRSQPGSPKTDQKQTFTLQNFHEEPAAIIQLVERSYQAPHPLRETPDLGLIGEIGFTTVSTSSVFVRLLQFIGETSVEMLRSTIRPKLIRVKELFVQLELAGIDAIPIVCLVTFLIGIVVAYLFGIQIARYGANILIVDAVGLAMCRELSPILVAIIVAGRSGSAFTAQIGTMKINEEIDAMTTIGLSPMQVLVLPRVFALMICMPLLTFVGDVMGILGSMVIADLRLDITGVTFLERLHVVLPVRSLFVGLIKAPVFAAFIAIIGCQLGLAVENNARSVGLNTTATVVRSIVAVILLNAAFAIIFVELGI